MHLCMYPNQPRLNGPASWFQDISGYDYHLHCDVKGNDLFLLQKQVRTQPEIAGSPRPPGALLGKACVHSSSQVDSQNAKMSVNLLASVC